jgi:outer membrane protein assembly factor BamB
MKKMHGLFGVAGCLLLIAASSVSAQDWPQWRGLNRDGKAVFTAPATWPKGLPQKWKAEDGPADATPALAGNKLYVATRQGSDEVTRCLDAATGKVEWTSKVATQAVSGAAARHPGPRSSPAVANGKIVTLGVSGVLSCLDAADGQLVWRKDPFPKTYPQFFTATSPLIADALAIAHLGGPGKGALLAYDLASGEEKWRWAAEGPDYASPVLMTVEGTKQVVTLTEKSVVGVGLADGRLLWQIPFKPQQRSYNASTPIVDGQTVYFGGANRGTKAVKIEKTADGFAAKELWSNDLAPQYASAVLKDGYLYNLSNKGNLFCIHAADGKTAWTDSVARDRSGFGSLVECGSVLMLLTSNGDLVVFKPNPEKFEEVAKYKVGSGATYAHPVVSGSRIFIQDQEAVTLYSAE